MFLSANIHGTNIFMLRIEHALEKRILMGDGGIYCFYGGWGNLLFFYCFQDSIDSYMKRCLRLKSTNNDTKFSKNGNQISNVSLIDVSFKFLCFQFFQNE